MVTQGGLTITIDDAQMQAALQQIADRGTSLQAPLSAIGSLLRESIRTNFAAGGRPTPWKALKNRDGQPLRDTGRLMNSITKKVGATEVSVGTNVVYAALHHFGAKRGSFGIRQVKVKAHARLINQVFGRPLAKPKKIQVGAHLRAMALPWGNIPARPFMLVQEEDRQEMFAIIKRYIEEAKI